MKIKLITGYRADQVHSVDADEAHKAYYLFLNPDARTIFKNGLAIIGSDIHRIEPDYHATMGWNPTHVLDSNDYNQIQGKEIDVKLRDALAQGKDVAYFIMRENRKELINLSLSEASKFAGMKSIGELGASK